MQLPQQQQQELLLLQQLSCKIQWLAEQQSLSVAARFGSAAVSHVSTSYVTKGLQE
jgi:hypothetical protein